MALHSIGRTANGAQLMAAMVADHVTCSMSAQMAEFVAQAPPQHSVPSLVRAVLDQPTLWASLAAGTHQTSLPPSAPLHANWAIPLTTLALRNASRASMCAWYNPLPLCHLQHV